MNTFLVTYSIDEVKKQPLFLAPVLQYIPWYFPMLCLCADSTFIWKERKIDMKAFLSVLELDSYSK